MAESWPETLPGDVLVAGYSESLPNAVLRTEMDAGPAKVRRRSTAAARPLRATMALTRTQAAALDTFFTTTLSMGSLPFTLTHPRTLSQVSFRFVSPPVLVPVSGAEWSAELDLEVLP